jgi:polar amino acid transport system substrate-binding protein
MSAVLSALAPGGTLRAAINLGNSLLARLDEAGQPVGVSVDLARALAARLGCQVEFVVVDGAAKSVAAVRNEQADVGFFAIDPLRGEGLRFTAPYLLIEGSFLVAGASPLRGNDEVDRAGHRVLVSKGSAYDLYLTRELKSAQVLRDAAPSTVVETFARGGYEVAAGVRQQLEAEAARHPGHRLLPGRFMVIEQAMGLPAGRGDAASGFLAGFVEEMKESGFVAACLLRHGVKGAIVAAAA